MKNKYREIPWLSPKVVVHTSQIHGRGIFATSPIEPGEILIVWGGAYLTKEEAEKERAAGKLIQQIDHEVFEVFTREMM